MHFFQDMTKELIVILKNSGRIFSVRMERLLRCPAGDNENG